MAKVIIDPISRIEGHLSLELDVQNGIVKDAKSKGDMFRGFEKILQGRNPVDANQITQRICGVCPISHGLASSKCLDGAFGIKPNDNGRILRNLVLAANYLQSHILHFYHLAALDFVDITALLKYKGSNKKMIGLKKWAGEELKKKKGKADAITAVAPFLPRYEGKDFYKLGHDIDIAAIEGYVQALDIRIKAHKMVALFGGRVPHAIGLVPGGVTQVPTSSKIKEFRSLLKEIEEFVNGVYTPHVLAVAGKYKEYANIGKFANFLSYGVFDLAGNKDQPYMLEQGTFFDGKPNNFDSGLIREEVKYARYNSASNLHPYDGDTEPNPAKAGAYTWLKAPRYNGLAMEVGPLARVAVAYTKGNKGVKDALDGVLKTLGVQLPAAFSVLGRHASRAIECSLICKEADKWLDELEEGGKPRSTYDIPDSGKGEGLTEAPRGALGHWIVVEKKKIKNYQCVVPTTWYCGPTDDKGVKGPVEQALIGTPIADPNNPIEAARVVRSFDPCIACAVHVVEGDKEIGTFRIT
ncbi:MAG: nickel-dependent hydrogenase large subunit [bacterium]|nr:nickel-dependent hydrogenase large subunit [bacterium]